MNHKGTCRIESERLLLRRFELSDAPAMFANWASDATTAQWMSWNVHPSVSYTAEVVSGITVCYSNPAFYNWVIEVRETGEIIGSIALAVNEYDEAAELSYCIGSRFRNHGYMTEAVGLVIRFCFTEVGFHKILACYSAENVASGRVMQKNRMIFEGRLREQHQCHDGTFSDLLYYGILSNEYIKNTGG